jgi:cobalt/nickel transport protein
VKKQSGILILILAIVLSFLPLLLKVGSDFEGADGLAEEAILEIASDYEPWAEPLFEPPSGEIESLLFGLQAAIGAGFIGYFMAYSKFRKERVHGA